MILSIGSDHAGFELRKLVIEHLTEAGHTIIEHGAADSATGTQSGNQDLGKRRAKFIAKALIKRGIDKSQIKAYNLGGIDKYPANEANRFTTVVLLK